MKLANPILVLTLLAFTSGCGVKEIPPPKAPEKKLPTVPDLPTDAPPRGASRVVLDTPDEQARVVEIMGVTQGVVSNGRGTAYASAVTTRPVCTTPCVVDLERGTHRLVFASQSDDERISEAEVQVGTKPTVVRHAIGSRRSHVGLGLLGGTSLVLGITGLTVGGVLYGVGAGSSSKSADGVKDTGTMLLLVGGGLTVVGAIVAYLARPEIQPGSTTQWPLGPETPSPGGSTVIHRTALGPRIDSAPIRE